MNNQRLPDFILIDDDSIGNLICSAIIQVSFPNVDISSFTDPEKGLEYIRSHYMAPEANDAILFLDLNMPRLDGWDLLDEFKLFSDVTKLHFKIFLLSSSINEGDRLRSDNNPLVTAYIEKPLTQAKLMKLFL